jgi:hypothetical protein
VFNQYGTNRLTEWKEFRDRLENSNRPLEDVAEFWSHAPFVNRYLNPNSPDQWPDPWHLVLDNHYDDLAIALGMLYTIKLTQRFMKTKCEIHTSILPKEKSPRYILVVDNSKVLNLEYKNVVDFDRLDGVQTNMVWKIENSL